jgi:hypothetical protein
VLVFDIPYLYMLAIAQQAMGHLWMATTPLQAFHCFVVAALLCKYGPVEQAAPKCSELCSASLQWRQQSLLNMLL